jgi:hypothetical protein
VDGVRREVQSDKTLPEGMRINAKESMWIVRHKQENLKDYQRPKLDELEKVNATLYRIYLHKESFFELYNFLSSEVEEARKFIVTWVDEGKTLGFESLNNFCDYITRAIQRQLENKWHHYL